MFKLQYLSIFSDETAVTGGQIYEKNLLTVAGRLQGIEAETVGFGHCSGLQESSSPLWLSPLRCLIHGLRNCKGDAIIVNSTMFTRFLPLIAALRLTRRCRIHVVHHHFYYRQFSGVRRLAYRLAEWGFLKLAHRVIIPSPYMKEEVATGIPARKILYWRIPFMRHRQQERKNPEPGNLIFAGTIERRKGLHLLLEALNILQERGVGYKQTIIGKTTDEDYRRELDNYISSHSLNVEFTDYISTEEKERLLSEADIFTFPSLLEGFGMAMAEAQAYGVPVVCFNNSAMPYTVAHGESGYVTENGRPLPFAEAIIRIVEDRELRDRLSAGALRNAERQTTQADFEKEVACYFQGLTAHR